MKTLKRSWGHLDSAKRWDIDFHLPAEGINAFPLALRKRVDSIAFVAKDKRDPTRMPDQVFQYIDIASVDVQTGTIVNPQEMTGEEAPSRARKVVRAYDVIVSTCRPTRGAIAVVPVELHNQVASTAFSVLRARPGVNPFYLHYVLRLASTLEQFRKWSTGSSYPAILDEDVEKTIVPVPDLAEQDRVAFKVTEAFKVRTEALREANLQWQSTLDGLSESLAQTTPKASAIEAKGDVCLSNIEQVLADLPPLTVDITKRRKAADINLSDLLADLHDEVA